MDEGKKREARAPAVTSVELIAIEPLAEGEFGWVRLAANFDDDVTDAHPGMRFDVPVRFQPSWTVEQIETAARNRLAVLVEAPGSRGV